MATRLEKVLDLLISPDQTGFLKGRYIGQNIRMVNDEGRPIFYRRWLNKNVFLLQDLLGDDGKVLSYSEFFRKFRLKGNFLQYLQVVSAIPKDLIDDARRYHIDKTSILFESSFQLSADLSLDLLKMKNRNYILAFDQ